MPDICLTKVCFACTPVLLSSPLTRRASPLLRTSTGVTRRQGRMASSCAAALMRDGGARELAASDLIPGHYEGDTQRRLTLLLAVVSSERTCLAQIKSPRVQRQPWEWADAWPAVPGGFKLWEGGLDLARFLCSRWELRGEALFGAASAVPSGAHEGAAAAPACGTAASGGASAAPAGASAALADSRAAAVDRGCRPPSTTHVAHAGAGQPGALPARVLELGCGQALPGVLALLAGAEVHFQARRKLRLHVVSGFPLNTYLGVASGCTAQARPHRVHDYSVVHTPEWPAGVYAPPCKPRCNRPTCCVPLLG